ncbi:MAG: hypothetical protein KME17_11495 [Cyanosarcina radialis HA8281-LM2]|jgi:hypothetical protein|nr:hypothetical protein [Cyanosarcina radialis HA8281-LM2]
MSIYKLFENLANYIYEGVARIFGPTNDAYPAIGVQPFDGEPLKRKHGLDW